MARLILAFDVGTTAVKAGLVDASTFEVVAYVQRRNEVLFPQEGWAEQNPEDLWHVVSELSAELGNRDEVVGVVFATQMAGVLPVDKDGAPLRRMIIWLDERGRGYPRGLWGGALRVKGYNLFRLMEFIWVTGGAPSATGKDPLSKMLWLRDNEPDVWSRTYKFLDVKAYLLYRATGVFVTSPDEANLTWLLDTRRGRAEWNLRLAGRYGVPPEKLPAVKKSVEVAGRLTHEAARELGLPPDLPVFVGSGDMAAAAVGSGAVGEGEMHVYVGTSDWVAAHVRERRLDLFHYVGSIHSAIPGAYLLVAEQEVAGAALDKVMELLGVADYGEVERLVSSAEPGAGGMIFLPWLYGERAPIDDPHVRGGVINLSLRSGRGQMLRAVMEGVAMNIRWAFRYVERLARFNPEVRVVGGGALSDTWCQILADVLGRVVVRVSQPRQAVLRGAAAVAAVGLGLYSNFIDAAARFRVDRRFAPSENRVVYDKLFNVFVHLYRSLKNNFKSLNLQ